MQRRDLWRVKMNVEALAHKKPQTNTKLAECLEHKGRLLLDDDGTVEQGGQHSMVLGEEDGKLAAGVHIERQLGLQVGRLPGLAAVGQQQLCQVAHPLLQLV